MLQTQPKPEATSPAKGSAPARFTRTEPDERVVYRFDRRQHPRRSASGQCSAFRRDHALPAYRFPTCSLQLRDISEGGLGAISDTPLETDEQISIYFTPHGSESGFELHGRVVRCRPLNEAVLQGRTDTVCGYDIGISFSPGAAA